MRKCNKTMARAMATALAFTALLSGTACGGSTDNSGKPDPSKTTVINVANFGGGIGRKWLDEAIVRFQALKEGESYETGKTGVAFDVTHVIGVSSEGMKTDGTHVYFLQDKYFECFTQIQNGFVMDITDIVKEETLAEYGENVTIESKINEDYRFAMKGNDGQYYMLPHYETQSGASYDVDLFKKEGFFLAKTGEGVSFNSALTGNTYYFTGDASEMTVGNDGLVGTDDDGMPTTLNELVAMCEHMMDEGVTPFSVAGSHIDYTNYFIEGLWTALGGYDQRSAVVSHKGTVDYVKGMTEDELWAGSGIYVPEIETVTLAGDSTDGYKAIDQAARYYAYAFIELAYQQGWFYEKYTENNYTHKEAMRAFILNGLAGNKKLGAHVEGSYWYNEAESYNLFNDYKIWSGTGSSIKNIKHWNMPTSVGNDVVTGTDNAREEALINGMTSTIMINGNLDDVPGKEGLIRACKDFVKFLCTEQELDNFTACTGVSKALYDYSIDDKVLAELDPYQKSVMTLRANNRVVNQYGDNATYRAKSGVMTYSISATGFHPYFDGIEYTSPLEAYYKTAEKKSYKNAYECFRATGFSQSKWMSEVYKAD